MAIDRSRVEASNIGVIVNSSRGMLSESFIAGNNFGVYVSSQGGLQANTITACPATF